VSDIRPINPYVAGPPLSEEKGFFGRQGTLKWVEQELRNLATNSLVLFGQRRIGKTTLLLQLRRLLPADAFLPIYFDLQDQAQRPLGQVLASLAEETAQWAGVAASHPDDFDDEGQFFQNIFLPKIHTALGEGRRVVFLLDEFDVLDQPARVELHEMAAAKTLFPFVRQVMINAPYVAFVFVVGRQAEDLSIDYKSTFKTSLAHEIWVLDHESAVALVRQAQTDGSLTFLDEAAARILSLTSGHPYLTQLICQRIWERAYTARPVSPPIIGEPEVDAAIPLVLEAGGPALEWLWDGLRPQEKVYASALAEIAEEGTTIPEDQVIQALSQHAVRLRTQEVVRDAPHRLVQRRILEEAGERDYRFAVELFRRWVGKNKRLRDVKDELDRLDPQANEHFRAGYQLFIASKWDEAVPYFQDTLRENPRHFRARFCLGIALLELGRANMAVSQLEQAYELDRDEARYELARAWGAQAQIHQEAGEEEAALSACERALEIYPNEHSARELRSSIWSKRGDAALEQDDLDTALNYYQLAGNEEKASQVRALRQGMLEREAVAYEQQGQWAMAIAAYQRLLDRTEDENLQDKWKTTLKRIEYRFKDESLKARTDKWLPGSVLDDRYKIIGRIGVTARCEIYLAEELQPPRDTVTVKRLKPDRVADVDALARFEWEATVLRRLRHPAVLSLYDIKIGGGEYYFVTEFADRGSLKDYAATKPDHKLAPLVALEIAIAIGHGLDTAHKQGIIHRDIKPSNILLFSQADGGIIAKLADFGIARIPDRRLTQTGWFVGTPLYASPEQLAAGLVDARSDIYSWGAVFFEMLTGKVLKELLADGSTDNAVMLDRFPETFFIENGVPQQFVAALQRALHTDPRRRYQTAREALDDLESIRRALSRQAQGAIEHEEPPYGQTLEAKARAWLRRNRARLAFSGALLVILLVLAAIIGPLWTTGIVPKVDTPTSTLSAGAHTLTSTTTPTLTPTPTRTPSPTQTTSLTFTPTATVTPALRRTPTRTASPTRTFTPAPLPTKLPLLDSPTPEVPPFPTRVPNPTATLPPFDTRTPTPSSSTR